MKLCGPRLLLNHFPEVLGGLENNIKCRRNAKEPISPLPENEGGQPSFTYK
jgi:hypothetical protein